MSVYIDRNQRCTIANVAPFDFYESRSYGPFIIPACPKGHAYSHIIIQPRSRKYDVGDGIEKCIEIPDMSALDMAKDIAKDHLDHGVFVCAGLKPTAAELEEATLRLTRYYERMLAEGDREWAKTGKHEGVDDNSRRASIYLGQEREWAMNIRNLVECPFCGGRVKPGIAKCPVNGCILNPELAALAGLITMEERDRLVAARKGGAGKKQMDQAKGARLEAGKNIDANVNSSDRGVGAEDDEEDADKLIEAGLQAGGKK